MDKQDCILMGRFGRPHGVKGYSTLISFAEPPVNLFRYKPWYIFQDNRLQPLKIEKLESRDQSLLVRLEAVQDRDQAARYTNLDIYVEASQLPKLPEGEFYWHELKGMSVLNQDGLLLGTVQDLVPTGANDILVVKGAREHWIPYLLGRYVLTVNSQSREIHVDWDPDF